MEKRKVKIILNRSLIILFILLVVIQAFHPANNNNTTITQQDITILYPMKDSIKQILQKACYDCHSNNTVYPWYSRIQPVAWWLNDHIEEGKRHINFSEFGKYPLAKQAKKIKKCASEIEESEMPLDSYLWIHKNAIMSSNEKEMIINWAKNLSLKIEANSAIQPSK